MRGRGAVNGIQQEASGRITKKAVIVSELRLFRIKVYSKRILRISLIMFNNIRSRAREEFY